MKKRRRKSETTLTKRLHREFNKNKQRHEVNEREGRGQISIDMVRAGSNIKQGRMTRPPPNDYNKNGQSLSSLLSLKR